MHACAFISGAVRFGSASFFTHHVRVSPRIVSSSCGNFASFAALVVDEYVRYIFCDDFWI